MTHSHKRFAYFGTPYVARDTLSYLVEQGFIPEVVITAPDAPRGRGMVVTPCETRMWATEHSIPTLTPRTLDTDTIEALASYQCDYAIVVAYGKIIPQTLIDAFPLGIINIHYSLLPQYRGASPVETSLLHGDTVTGVAIQRMVFALDAGDILAMRETKIGPTETTRELRPRLISLGAETLVDILPMFEDRSIVATPQDHTRATRCSKIKKESGLLDLTGDARTNWNTYRAYAESPGTYFFVRRGDKDIRVKIKTATFDEAHFTPLRVIPEGKQEMEYADFVR